MTADTLLATFQNELSKRYTPSEIRELLLIFTKEILNLNRLEFRYWDGSTTSFQESAFRKVLSELKQGRPYQQIIGKTEFFGKSFLVNEYTLIPRPETEELLEITIKHIEKYHFQKPLKILDIGTGSGVIPIILKLHFPDAEIFSVDISRKALDIAEKNAMIHRTEIHFIHRDFLTMEAFDMYDIIISNPPYIGRDERPEINESVKDFEPETALFSPTEDPLIFYRKISCDAPYLLKKNGSIFLEINQKLGKETADLFQNFSSVTLLKDLSQNERFIIVRNDIISS